MRVKFFTILILLFLFVTGCTYREDLNRAGEELLAEGDLERAEMVFQKLIGFSVKYPKGHVNMGFIYLYYDRVDEAIESFNTALKYNKKPDLEYLGLGHAYILKGNFEKARQYLEEARALKNYPATEYLLGFIYLDNGEAAKARRSLRVASKAYPERGEVWAALGKLFLENLQTLDAVQAYQMAYVNGIRSYDLYIGLAESYFQLGNFRQAVAVAEQALKEEHITQQEKEQLALKLAQYNVNQNPSRAITSFESILAKNPNKPEVLLMLGQLYFQQEMYKKSIDTYNTFLKLYPPLAPVLHLMFRSYLVMNDLKMAEKYLKETINLKPNNFSYHLELLDLYHSQDRLIDTIPVYESALRIKPDDDDLLTNLCAVFFQLKQYEKAIPYLERAIAQNPARVDLYQVKAQVYYHLRQIDKEQEAYEAILKVQPKNLTVLNNLGQIYRETDRLDDAMSIYQKTLSIATESGVPERNIGSILLLKGDYTGAREWLTKSITKNSNDYVAYRYLADTYYGEDLYRLAVRYYEKSIELKPDYYNAMFPLGKAYFYLNDLALAQKYFEEYKKRYPLNESCDFYLTRIKWLRNQKTPGFKILPATPVSIKKS